MAEDNKKPIHIHGRHHAEHRVHLDAPPEGADEPAIRRFEEEEEKEMKLEKKVVYGVFVGLILLGVLTGYLLTRGTVLSSQDAGAGVGDMKREDGKLVVGSEDTKTFRDSATGVIEEGGMDGEGTHKLTRDGGPSQTVYLTSTVIDLDQFKGKKVTIWGETIAAKKAAWLMDVGKIELE